MNTPTHPIKTQPHRTLLAHVQTSGQTLLTTTDTTQFDPAFVKAATQWHIIEGRLEV